MQSWEKGYFTLSKKKSWLRNEQVSLLVNVTKPAQCKNKERKQESERIKLKYNDPKVIYLTQK